MIFEYIMEIEKDIPPIELILERIRDFLKTELHSRQIYEYTKSDDARVLISCKLYYNDPQFKIGLFDGIVVGSLWGEYDSIMLDDKLKETMTDLVDSYFQEHDGLGDSFFLPCFDYYKSRRRVVLDIKEEF